jgi:hypothetical protein
MATKPATKRQDIKNLCSEAAERHGQKPDNLTTGFELLAIETLAHDPDLIDSIMTSDDSSSMKFNDWHTGGPNDGGIDGLLFSEDLSRVIVIQTKYKSGKLDEDTRKEARDFFSRIPEWSDIKSRSTFNPETQRLLDDSQFDPKQQLIDLYFITYQTGEDVEYESIADNQTKTYQDAGFNVRCNFLAFTDFNQIVADSKASRNESIVKEVTMQIPLNQSFVFEGEAGMRVLVATVKAQAIEGIYSRRDVRNNLFNTNVRSALSTGRINPKVAETAADPEDSKYFYYFNNGITATCTNFELDEKNNSVTMFNLQVVNGAQTVAALSKAVKRNRQSKAHVMMRIIETNETYKNKSNVADLITRYQNTQNPVKLSDFFSNEPFHKWIETMIDSHSGKNDFPAIWYEYKRGVKSGSKTGRKKLSMEELAYLRYACLWGAPFTYKNQRDIWNGELNNQNFWKAFGRDEKEVQIWTPEETYETLWMIKNWLYLKAKAAELNIQNRKNKDKDKDKEALSQNPEKTYLGVMARYVTALAFHLMCDIRDKGNHFNSFSELEKPSKELKDLEIKVLNIVRKAVKGSFENDWKNVANPRLNMPQNADTWASLKVKVIIDFDFEEALD